MVFILFKKKIIHLTIQLQIFFEDFETYITFSFSDIIKNKILVFVCYFDFAFCLKDV